MSSNKKPPSRPRVVVIGDSSVGKTSILTTLVGDDFNLYEQNTIGANWHLQTEDVNGEHVELQIWDTAGQERYRSLGPLYYRNAVAGIVVYDITNRGSFQSIPGWIDSFRSIAGTETVIFVVGNKCDLADRRQVPFEEASDWAKEREFDFFETSAKTSDGIEKLFQKVAGRIWNLQNQGSVTSTLTPQTGSGCC
jgi:small GTP-binding protein